MFNLRKYLIVILAGIFFLPFALPAQAASQDECSIWLCLPGGFPSGCGGAKSAMKKRIKKGKSPLPNFSSCAVGGGSNLSYNHSVAAFVPAHQECVDLNDNSGECRKFKQVPAGYIKGTSCHEGESGREPAHCTATKSFIDVFIDGKLAGNTYYF